MIVRLDREESQPLGGIRPDDKVTFGDIYLDNAYFCCTLEDEVREVPFKPVPDWKRPGVTAIPSGMYDLDFERSARFGPRTLTVRRVPGFTYVRVHGGIDIDSTDGCIVVGDAQDRFDMTISGAVFHHVLEKLKDALWPTWEKGERIYFQVRNAPAWYIAHGLPVTKAYA